MSSQGSCVSPKTDCIVLRWIECLPLGNDGEDKARDSPQVEYMKVRVVSS